MNRKDKINEIKVYRNYMAQLEPEYEDYSMICYKLNYLRKHFSLKWLIAMNIVFILSLIFGTTLLLFNLHIIDFKIISFLKYTNIFSHFDAFLIILSIIMLIVVNVRESRYFNKIVDLISMLGEEQIKIVEKIERYYNDYENPPLSMEYSAPDVIDKIIEILESNDKLNVEEAIKICRDNYCAHFN